MIRCLYITFIILLLSVNVLADTPSNPYANCVYAWEVGNVKRNKVVVRTVGGVCYDTCQSQCAIFNNAGPGLNDDYFDECVVTCQSGSTYTRAPRIPNSNAKDPQIYQYGAPIATTIACTTGTQNDLDTRYAFFGTGITAQAGDRIIINLATNAGALNNEIYMCGFKTVMLYPNFWSLNSADWNTHTNQGNNPPWIIRNFAPTSWNARNNLWTDTGINIKDGDFLDIQYDGAFFSRCTATSCASDATDNDLQMRVPYNSGVWLIGGGIVIPGQNLNFRPLKVPMPTDGSTPFLDSPTPLEVYTNNSSARFFGLQARTTSDYRKISAFGNDMDNYRYGVEYYGILQGYSTQWTRLGLRHTYTDATHLSNYNVGGKTVKVVWRGCSYKDGDRLQYAIVLPEKDGTKIVYKPQNSAVEWHDVPVDFLIGRHAIEAQAPFTTDGQIFLRIKPLDFQSSSLPSCFAADPVCNSIINLVPFNYTQANTTGQYTVTVENQDTSGILEQYVGDIVNKVRTYFFGVNGEGGIVQRVFNNIINNARFPAAISALLALYLTWTGILFTIGMSPITQQEALVRGAKIGVVAVLLQPGSWEFFNTYLFNMVTDGGLELIAYVVSSGYQDPGITPQDYQTTPALIFRIFDQPLSYMVSHSFMFKMGAMLLSGVIGFIMGIIMIASCIILACAIGRMIMIYIVSLMVIALLLMLAPVFIVCILFKYTNELFQSWLKQLLSYIIQPMMLFAMMVLMIRVMSILLFHIMSFTACEVCIIPFDWTVGTEIHVCLLPWLNTMMNMHYPALDVISIPLRTGAEILCLYIVAHASYVLVDTIMGICSFLVSYGMGVGLTGLASEVNPIMQARETANMAAMLAGVDQEATATRDQGFAGGAKREYKAAKDKKSGGSGGGGGGG